MLRIALGLFMAFAVVAPAATPVKVQTLTQLDQFEPFEAHLWHSGNLFTGRSRKGIYADYHLYAFNGAGKLVAEAKLEHSARFIYAYGDNRVVVVGVSAEPNISRYSVVTLAKGKLTVERHDVPESGWANEVAVDAKGKLYFSDPGGMQEDGLDLSKASRTLFTIAGDDTKWLQTRIHAPTRPVILGGSMYVLESPSMGAAKNVLRVSLQTEKAESAVPKDTYALSNLVWLQGTMLLVAVDQAKKALLVQDPRADVPAHLVALPSDLGTPHAVTELGKCFVVAGQETKLVSFIDSKSGKELARWDLSSAGADLFGIRSLAVDPQTGNVFARSAYSDNPMAPGPEQRNGVVLATDDGSTLKACAQ